MAKILVFDIETAPHTITAWGTWQTDAIEVLSPGYILCFSYKWLGDKTVKTVALPDFALYQKDPHNDKEVVKVLHDLFNEADTIVAHNGDRFDEPYAQARFLYHRFGPPEPYSKVDTLKVAKKFKLPRNRLDDIARFLGIEGKAATGGYRTWKGCIEGDPASWKTMIKYNKQDVALLEEVYYALRPWMNNHPALNIINDENDACPKCGNTGYFQKRGWAYTKVSKRRRYQCQACTGWCLSRAIYRTDVQYVN